MARFSVDNRLAGPLSSRPLGIGSNLD